MISPVSRPRALITGASGVLGSQLVRYLVEHQWSVRTLTWQPSPHVYPEVANIVGDILDTAIARRSTTGVDVVFHLAGQTKTDTTSASMACTNVEGTSILARAARLSGVSRFVYFSSTSVYGDTTGTLADESSVPAPMTEYARTKLAAEVAALQEAPDGVVLRLGAVYGSHEQGNYFRLAMLCRRGVSLRGANRRSLIYEDDAMAAAVLAGEHPDAGGRIFNVTDGCPHTITDISRAILSALDRRGPSVVVPAALLGPLASVLPPVRRSLRKLLEDSAVESRRIDVELGFRPAWSLDRGWRETIRGWRARGLF